MSPEQLNDLRQRVLQGQEVTREELRAAIEALAPDRLGNIERAAAASTAAVTRNSKKAPSVDLGDLL